MSVEDKTDQLIKDGAAIQLLHGHHLEEYTLAKAQWLPRTKVGAVAKLRWCATYPEHQGHVRTLRFTDAAVDGDSVVLRRDGDVVGGIVPVVESGLDLTEAQQTLAGWRALLDVPGNVDQFEEFFRDA